MIWTIILFTISKLTKLLILTKNTVMLHNNYRSRTSNTFLTNPLCENRLNLIPLESSSDGQGWRLDGCLATHREDPFKLLSFLCSNVFFCKWSLFFCPFLFLTMHWKLSIFSSISSTRWSTYAQRSKLTCEVERDNLTDNFRLSLLFRSFIRKSELLQFSL